MQFFTRQSTLYADAPGKGGARSARRYGMLSSWNLKKYHTRFVAAPSVR